MRVFELESEDLTGLGGPMGSEHTSTNWTKLFHDLSSAKEYAEKDYKKEAETREKIKWYKDGNRWHTQDLLFVMYNITTKGVD